MGRLELETPDGSCIAVFVKRQSDHVARSFRHPLRGELTVVREFASIQRAARANVPTQTVLYCAERKEERSRQGILITLELNAMPLDAYWETHDGLPSRRREVLAEVARVVARLHAHRLQHNALYPKHVFVESGEGPVRAYLIDLEKTRQRFCQRAAVLRDLDALNRRSAGTRTDRMRFLRAYMGSVFTRASRRKLWCELSERQERKLSRRREGQS